MRDDLQTQFEEIQRQRAKLENRALTFSDAQLRWSPNAATWSTLQIIEHLVLGDETVGRAGHNGASQVLPPFRPFPRAWRRALVLTALRRDIVLPLPMPELEPRGDASLSELLSRWEVARCELLQALNGAQDDTAPFAHPVTGPLSMVQLLELSVTHNAYHTRQAERLWRDEKFPR